MSMANQEPRGHHVRARLRALPWRWIIPAAVGIGFGLSLGMQHAVEATTPGLRGIIPGDKVLELVAGLFVGVSFVLGLILLTTKSSAAGRGLLIAALSFGIGWVAGDTFGPRWQPPQELTGVVTLHLRVPVEAERSASATCLTVANGDRIDKVSSGSLGNVGIDALAMRLSMWDPPAIELLVNGVYGYTGDLTDFDLSADAQAGSGAFSAQADRARIGGPTSGSTASGSITWDCTSPPSAATGSAAPAPTVPATAVPGTSEPAPTDSDGAVGFMQGYFDLHGLVEWVTCPDDGACKPYGHASGACSRALELRTDAIETVVPWTGNRQARLRVEPSSTSASLTVELGDGSPAETVEASDFSLTTVQVGPDIDYRRVTATFELAEGSLSLYVEWECAFEEPGE